MADIFGSFSTGFQQGRQIRDDRMKRNALLQAGEAFKGGDYGGAANALFASDPNAAIQMQQYGAGLERQQKADDLASQQRERDKAMAGMKAFAQAAQGLKRIPVEGRFQAAQQIIPELAAGLGADPASILKDLTPEKLTDENLDSFSAMMLDPEAYATTQQKALENQRAETKLGLDERRVAALEAKAFAPQGGGGGQVQAPAAGGPTPMPEYGPNAFKLANGSIVEIYRDKQGQPRIGKTLLTGPGGGNPDTVKTILTQRAGRQSLLLQDIGRAKKLAEKGATGLGSMLSGFPATSSKDLAALLETIKSNIGFAELQAMRDSSPTGGALGQVTERELSLLQAVVGSLDQAQSREQFTANLDRLERQYQQSMAAIAAAYERDFGQPLDLGSGLPAPYPEAGSWKPSGSGAAQGTPVEKVIRGPDGKLTVTR